MLMVVIVVVIVLVLMVVIVAVVMCWWYGCHIAHGDVAPAFSVKGRKGEGECDNSPTYGQTVMMASIVTVWMTWHIAMSSPACSIPFRRGWCPLLSLWVASDCGGW